MVVHPQHFLIQGDNLFFFGVASAPQQITNIEGDQINLFFNIFDSPEQPMDKSIEIDG